MTSGPRPDADRTSGSTVPGARGHRRTVLLVVGTAAVVVAVVLAIVLPRVLGGPGAAGSPRAAAQAWGDAALHHDAAALKRLSCPSAAGGFGIYALSFNGTGVAAGAAVSTGTETWRVTITTTGPLGGTSLPVRVEKRDGKYLVC